LRKDREEKLTRVNIGLGELKALLRPGSEVLILQLSLVDGVLGGKVGHDVGVVGPLLVAERLVEKDKVD